MTDVLVVLQVAILVFFVGGFVIALADLIWRIHTIKPKEKK